MTFLIYHGTLRALRSKEIRAESGYKIPKGLSFIPWWLKTRVIVRRKTLIKAMIAEKKGLERKYTLIDGSLGWRFFQALHYKDFTLPPELSKCSRVELALLMFRLGVFEDSSLLEIAFSPHGGLIDEVYKQQEMSAKELEEFKALSELTVETFGRCPSVTTSIKSVGGWLVYGFLEKNEELGLGYLTSSRYPLIESYALALKAAYTVEEGILEFLLKVERAPANVQETFRTLLRDAKGTFLTEQGIDDILTLSYLLEEVAVEA